MGQDSSTLAGSERQWAPVVLAIHHLCVVAGVVMLGYAVSCTPCVMWVICLAAWLAPQLSNVWYLRNHALPTVGMAPISAVGLAPAAACGLYASACHSTAFDAFVWAICLITLVLGTSVALVVGAWCVRLRLAYHRKVQIPPDTVILVLGGAVYHGRPCRSLAFRLNVAAALMRDAPCRTLVLTGGPLANEPGTEAEAMADYLLARGIGESRMVLEQCARNTRENIQNSLATIRARGLPGTLCVLTSDYHLYRALREGRSCGIELVPIPAPTPLASCLQQWCREVITIVTKH